VRDTPFLEVLDLEVSYGNIPILWNVSMEVNLGEIVCVIGSNGAGKTTLLNTISGVVPCKSGSVRFQGREITGFRAHKVVDAGIVQVPEGRHLFPYMTVLENLELGAYTHRARSKQKEILEEIFQLLPVLSLSRGRMAATLSGGEQQMLAIGRGLMAKPDILILDEPSFGLAPTMVETVFDFLKDLNTQGTTILLVEQNVSAALYISHRGYVLENGRIALQGTSRELADNEKVKKAYLGI
jgi:branched-chain amino acid transport system ATP-binding protein